MRYALSPDNNIQLYSNRISHNCISCGVIMQYNKSLKNNKMCVIICAICNKKLSKFRR